MRRLGVGVVLVMLAGCAGAPKCKSYLGMGKAWTVCAEGHGKLWINDHEGNYGTLEHVKGTKP